MEQITVNLKDLKYTLQHCSKDVTRLFLNGVCFQDDVMVATNGHTLKYVTVEGNVKGSYIVPSEAVDIILKTIKAFKNSIVFNPSVLLKFTEGHVMVKCSQVFEIKFKLIEREFPKWRMVIPDKLTDSMTITKWEYPSFKKSLGKSKKIVLSLRDGDVYLCYGESENQEELIGYTSLGRDMDIGVNASYMHMASENLSSFEIKFTNETTPLEINGVIVMPLRL